MFPVPCSLEWLPKCAMVVHIDHYQEPHSLHQGRTGRKTHLIYKIKILLCQVWSLQGSTGKKIHLRCLERKNIAFQFDIQRAIRRQILSTFCMHACRVGINSCRWVTDCQKSCSHQQLLAQSPADMKKAQAPQACLGNILDGWGTFWTKISAALSPCEVCRKLCICHMVFKVKMGTLSTRSYDSLIVQIFEI